MSGVTVAHSGGRLLAVKQGDPSRLRREADVLRRLDHPGLVSFVSLDEVGPLELRTVFAGPDSWYLHPPAGNRAIVAGLAAVAATVADLHDADATHGSVAPAHVISSPDGRPVLCSLGDSRGADDAGRSADMEGLGDLIDHCRRDVGGVLGRQLESLAARCRDTSLGARALARELDALAPTTTGPRARPDPRRRVVTAAVAAAGAAVVLGVGWATVRGSPGAPIASPPDRPAATTVAPPRSVITGTSTTPAATPALASSATPTESPTSTTRPSTQDDIAPLELVHDGRRYHLGRGGDLVVVGDWNCNGVDTPALLRIDSSLLAVFDSWPPPEGAVEPSYVATVTATNLDREAHDECDLLRVRTASGSELVVLPTTP